MDALIGLSGVACLFLGVPVTVAILLFKIIKKKATKKDKQKPLCLMATGIVLIIIGLILTPEIDEIGVVENNATTEVSEQGAEDETSEGITEIEDVTTEVPAKEEDGTSFEYANMDVKFVKYEIEEDAAGTQCLVLYFDFTNNDDESHAFDYTFTVKAFQDGIELKSTYFHVNDETHNAEKEIKQGVTLKVAEQFEIKDVSGKIEIEVEPFNIWSDRTLFEYSFNLD